jgi:hypothetical protein
MTRSHNVFRPNASSNGVVVVSWLAVMSPSNNARSRDLPTVIDASFFVMMTDCSQPARTSHFVQLSIGHVFVWQWLRLHARVMR